MHIKNVKDSEYLLMITYSISNLSKFSNSNIRTSRYGIC